jgi:pSer/pThr/pTyr-binding forkhead associated (FHA) protein
MVDHLGVRREKMVLRLRRHIIGRLLAINPVDPRSREFILREPQSSIGSDESNDVVVRDPTVSRQHAIAKRRKRRWELVDANSSNGTFVGDTRITHKPASLGDGQEIRFGGARFVFRETPLAASQREDRRVRRPSKKPAFSLRTASEFVVLAFIIGFAVMQYLSYLNFKRTREHGLSGHADASAAAPISPPHSTGPASGVPSKYAAPAGQAP